MVHSQQVNFTGCKLYFNRAIEEGGGGEEGKGRGWEKGESNYPTVEKGIPKGRGQGGIESLFPNFNHSLVTFQYLPYHLISIF